MVLNLLDVIFYHVRQIYVKILLDAMEVWQIKSINPVLEFSWQALNPFSSHLYTKAVWMYYYV